MKKILTIVGARPQFIKAAAIERVIADNYSEDIHEDLLHTGQHYDDAMSACFFRELQLPQPRYNLGVGSGTHGAQTAAMIKGIEEVILSEHYDGVLVYGDTNSTLAGAIAASKQKMPVYHVEAGLRSFDRAMPEEVNRVLTDHASTLLFAPTKTAVQNLKNEGFKNSQVVFSGDVMLDNMKHYSTCADWRWKDGKNYMLATVHRDFNTDNPERLKSILAALCDLGEKYRCDIVFPVHPRTRQRIAAMKDIVLSEQVCMVEPLSYFETIGALKKAMIVLTDSGGLQKEAYFTKAPCVVLRPETEWVEIVNAGAAILADADHDKIMNAVAELCHADFLPSDEFGDGHAAHKIIEAILQTA